MSERDDALYLTDIVDAIDRSSATPRLVAIRFSLIA